MIPECFNSANERRPMGHGLARVYCRAGVIASTVTGPAGRYSFVQGNGAGHDTRSWRNGHMTRCCAVDTRGSAREDLTRIVGQKVGTTLLPQGSSLHLGLFDMPMGSRLPIHHGPHGLERYPRHGHQAASSPDVGGGGTARLQPWNVGHTRTFQRGRDAALLVRSSYHCQST
jgi:hypothetical protein